MLTFLHGTNADSVARILVEGFSLDVARRSDPGDFGWGIYLTDAPSRARCYGAVVLSVEIDDSRFARIKNPYFLEGLNEVQPVTPEEKLFHGVAFRDGSMLSVRASSDDERIVIARRIRKVFVEAGYAGIIAGPDKRGQSEVVVFEVGAIGRVARS